MGYQGKGEEAIRYYQELTAMLPASWPLRNALGTAYLRLGRPAEALESLELSLSITGGSPDSSQALYLKGLAYRRLDETQKAIESFEQSLAVSPEGPNAGEVRRQLVNMYNSLAVAHLRENRAKEALEALEKSLTITQGSSGSGTALYLEGVAYRQLNELPKAVDSLEKSLEVDGKGPNAANAHRQLAEVYTALGDQAKADEHTRLADELSKS
jgi:tetratricopeptide (TPR) repeat protein